MQAREPENIEAWLKFATAQAKTVHEQGWMDLQLGFHSHPECVRCGEIAERTREACLILATAVHLEPAQRERLLELFGG